MPTIKLESQGAAFGNEFMAVIRESLNVQDWMRVVVTIRDQSFRLGSGGAPLKMMQTVTDLEAGAPIEVDIPDNARSRDGAAFDEDLIRDKLEEALISRRRAEHAFLASREMA